MKFAYTATAQCTFTYADDSCQTCCVTLHPAGPVAWSTRSASGRPRLKSVCLDAMVKPNRYRFAGRSSSRQGQMPTHGRYLGVALHRCGSCMPAARCPSALLMCSHSSQLPALLMWTTRSLSWRPMLPAEGPAPGAIKVPWWHARGHGPSCYVKNSGLYLQGAAPA